MREWKSNCDSYDYCEFSKFQQTLYPKACCRFSKNDLTWILPFRFTGVLFFLLLDLLEDLSLATNQPNLNCSKLERTKNTNKTKTKHKILNKLDSRLSKSDKTQKLKVHLSKDVSRQFWGYKCRKETLWQLVSLETLRQLCDLLICLLRRQEHVNAKIR